MATPSSPAAETDPQSAWRALVDRIKGGEAAFGERLYLLGAGPVPVEGASGGALTLDASGGVVLVVGLAEAAGPAGDQIARQLTAIGGLPGTKLREAGVDPDAGGGLGARHAAYFGIAEAVELNSTRRCLVVLAREPDGDALAALRDAIGASLGGVYVARGDAFAPVGAEAEPEIELEPEAPAEAEEAPADAEAVPADAEVDELEVPLGGVLEDDEAAEVEGPSPIEAAPAGETLVEDVGQVAVIEEEQAAPDLVTPYLEDESTTVIAEEADAVAERTGIAAWPIGNWIGLTMVVVGIVLAVIGVQALRKPTPEPRTNDQISTVATGVPADATHTRWIGQQRAVTLSDGTLVFVYSTGESLNLVKDGASSGATWEEPFVVDEVVGALSLSVDVDSKDRLHVAYSDGASINYVRLKDKPSGWKPSRLIQLDDDTTSLQVDVAWDEQNQTAHVVWVQQSDEGEAPAWAALTNEGGIHLAEPGILAEPGKETTVLVAAAADGRSSLLVTYRRGDQTTGWSSRYSGGRLSDGTWAFNEEEQVPVSSFAGAVDVLYDRQKTAHLVLRDDDAYSLAYFTKTAGEPWSDGEIAHDGKRVEEVDHPMLSYNAGEANLYLFFQTEEYDPAGEISYLVHPLGEPGWRGPYDITNPADAPEGALFPAAPDRVGLQTIVFWTTTGEAYQVDSAPVVGPQQ